MNVRYDKSVILDDWDEYIRGRGLPYYEDDHRLMMRQILQQYPFAKLGDLSDRDLVTCINMGSGESSPRLMRSFRYFLTHFDAFLEKWGLRR